MSIKLKSNMVEVTCDFGDCDEASQVRTELLSRCMDQDEFVITHGAKAPQGWSMFFGQILCPKHTRSE